MHVIFRQLNPTHTFNTANTYVNYHVTVDVTMLQPGLAVACFHMEVDKNEKYCQLIGEC